MQQDQPALARPPARPAEVLLELKDVRKTFAEAGQDRVVLDGVDAQIRVGAFVVLAGRSGSGKSTLLNLISGIDQPTSGTVQLGGHDLTRLSEQERTRFRRKNIGFVFQSFNLIPTLTVQENILLPLELNGMANADAEARALGLLEEVGLADRANTFPDRLSGGEQQRIAIVRALAHDPLLLLADEPTGNLDVHTAEQVLEVLDRLVRRAGKTMIVVTHDQELLPLADRVLTLYEGHLTEVEA